MRGEDGVLFLKRDLASMAAKQKKIEEGMMKYLRSMVVFKDKPKKDEVASADAGSTTAPQQSDSVSEDSLDTSAQETSAQADGGPEDNPQLKKDGSQSVRRSRGA